jgi:hypothetical protein
VLVVCQMILWFKRGFWSCRCGPRGRQPASECHWPAGHLDCHRLRLAVRDSGWQSLAVAVPVALDASGPKVRIVAGSFAR